MYGIHEAFPEYRVSDEGFVLRGKVKKPLKCYDRNGSIVVRLNSCLGRVEYYLRQLVWEAFNGPVYLDDEDIVHIDGNVMNCRLDNLKKVTREEADVILGLIDSDLPGEIWRPCPDAPTLLASNMGRVKIEGSKKVHPTRAHQSDSSTVLKNRVVVNRRTYHVDRLVWSAFYGSPEIGRNGFIDHINGDYLDDHLENLKPITLAERKRNLNGR